MMKRKEEINKAVNELFAAWGLGTSITDAERFMFMVRDTANMTIDNARVSIKKGVASDCIGVFSDLFDEAVEAEVQEGGAA